MLNGAATGGTWVTQAMTELTHKTSTAVHTQTIKCTEVKISLGLLHIAMAIAFWMWNASEAEIFSLCDSYLHFNESLMSLCGEKCKFTKFFSKKKIHCVHLILEQLKYGRLIEIAHGNDKTTLINSFLLLFSKLISSTLQEAFLFCNTSESFLFAFLDSVCILLSCWCFVCVCARKYMDAFRRIENILSTSSLKCFVWLNSFRAPVHCIGE